MVSCLLVLHLVLERVHCTFRLGVVLVNDIGDSGTQASVNTMINMAHLFDEKTSWLWKP